MANVNVAVEHQSTLLSSGSFEDPILLQKFLEANGIKEPTWDIEKLLRSAELLALLETRGLDSAFNEPFSRLLHRTTSVCHSSTAPWVPQTVKTTSKGVCSELTSTREDDAVQSAPGPVFDPDVLDLLPDWVDCYCVDDIDDRWPALVRRVVTHGRDVLISSPTQTFTFNIAFSYKTMEVRFILYHDGGLKSSPPADLRTEDGLCAFMRGVFCGVESRQRGRALELPLVAWVSREPWDTEELLHPQVAQNEQFSALSSGSSSFSNHFLSPEAHSRKDVLGTIEHLDLEELFAVACLIFGYPDLSEYRIPRHNLSDCCIHANEADKSLEKPTRRIRYTKVKCHPATDAPTPRALLETMMHAMLGHQILWSEVGLLHRDVSNRNVLRIHPGQEVRNPRSLPIPDGPLITTCNGVLIF